MKNASYALYTSHVLLTVLHLCRPHQELHTEAGSTEPLLLRRRRMAQVEKNTCQLFIQTDHLFYKYYKTREAVIAQVRRGDWTSYCRLQAACSVTSLRVRAN